ncbi:SDR family oxidoreductase [Desulfosporosinus sp. SYSU MS00001]|uniref:SDR family oxidoreductase n=1 Tax=Desulfosporosinus sp. SYSU MS00001 TaxID=3416284 RepID=UPI003CEFF463
MKVLILGSTGMLGYALMNEAQGRKFTVYGASRSQADIILDVTNEQDLSEFVYSLKPDVIINTVAITNLVSCEIDPGLSYRVNTRPVSILAEICNKIGAFFVQVSTDHYYTGDKKQKHTTTCPVCLLNEYARTKFAAEAFALTARNSLVVRTNIVGFRRFEGPPTFIEWVLKSLYNRSEIVLFEDFYTSSIEVGQFAKALFDLIPKQPRGIINLASHEVSSKKTFIEVVARVFGYKLENPKLGSVKQLAQVQRAESLGLDVAETEALLGYNLPNLSQVVQSLKNVYEGDEKLACSMMMSC